MIRDCSRETRVRENSYRVKELQPFIRESSALLGALVSSYNYSGIFSSYPREAKGVVDSGDRVSAYRYRVER